MSEQQTENYYAAIMYSTAPHQELQFNDADYTVVEIPVEEIEMEGE